MTCTDYYLNKANINKDIKSQQKELGKLKKKITDAIRKEDYVKFFL